MKVMAKKNCNDFFLTVIHSSDFQFVAVAVVTLCRCIATHFIITNKLNFLTIFAFSLIFQNIFIILHFPHFRTVDWCYMDLVILLHFYQSIRSINIYSN